MSFVMVEGSKQPMQQPSRKTLAERLDEYSKAIFTKYEYVLEPTTSALSIPFHAITMDKVSEHVSVSYEKKFVSRFGVQHLLNAQALSSLFPRWKYYEVENAPEIKEVVERLINILKGHSFYTIANKVEEFTTVSGGKFRVAEQLLQAVEKSTSVKVSYLANIAGGVDIIAGVESASEPGKVYGVAIYVGPVDGKSETPVPTINFACSCPVGSSSGGVMCKHVLSVLFASPHIVLGAVDYVSSGRADSLEYYINYWRERFAKLLSDAKSDVARAAYAYYLAKFLNNKGLLKKATGEVNRVLDEVSSHISTGSIGDWLRNNYVTVQEVATEVRRYEVKEPGRFAKIVWTPEMERIREKVVSVIKDLSRRFGSLSDRGGEWETLLVFGAVMSSIVSPTRPPTVLHVIGDIGTFKTTGARLVAQYIELPVLVVSYRGSDVVEKYRELLNTISKYLGIPVPEIENKVGGVIAHMQPYKDGFTVSLSLQYLYSHAVNVGNPLLVRQFVEELSKLGFTLDLRTVKPKTAVVDPAQLSNIEDYRMKYIPDDNFGIITQFDLFDNYVVVIDEGCRNLHGLEALLTKMSISTINESVRLIVVTDNLEPFMASVRDARYAPFHDRTIKVLTRAIRDESVVSEHLHNPVDTKLNVLELIAAQRFIENIPTMPGFVFLAKAVAYALTYKYTIKSIKAGVKHVRPLSRNERADIELDVFAGSNFKFISGSRFVYHTIMLAKFLAFLNKRDYVTVEDFANAVSITARTRMIVDAGTIRDYKMTVVDVISNLKRTLASAEYFVKRAQEFAAVLESGDTEKISAEFKKIITEGNQEPFILSVALATLETMMALNKIKLDTLPDNVKFTLAELMLEKEDILGLEPIMKIIENIRSEEMKEISPKEARK